MFYKRSEDTRSLLLYVPFQMPIMQFHRLLLVILTMPWSTSFPHTCKSSSLTNVTERLSRNGPKKPFHLFEQGCFDCTAWAMLSESCADQDEYADAHTCQFLYRLLHPLKDCHNLCKWQTLVLKGHQTQIHCKNTDKGQYKAAKYEAEKAIRRAKAQYRNKLEKQFSTSNSHAVWQGLQQITQYKQKPTPANNDPTLPDQLNHFYSIFDRTPPKLQATLALSRLCPQTQIQVSHHIPSLSRHGRWKISSQS